MNHLDCIVSFFVGASLGSFATAQIIIRVVDKWRKKGYEITWRGQPF